MAPSSTVRSAVVIRRSIGILLNVALIGLIAIVVVTEAVGPIVVLLGRTPFVIGGGSMSPSIPRGALVIVEPAARPLEVREVASFRTPAGVVVTHRVTRVVKRSDGTWLETKGDANVHPDPALWPDTSVVGRVVVVAPGLGYVSWLLRTPLGWLNFLAILTWLLLARRLIAWPEVPSAELARAPALPPPDTEPAATAGSASATSPRRARA